MMNIKTIAALTFAVTPLFIGAAAQEAKAMCFNEEGVTVCVTNIALQPGGFDSFTVRGYGINEKMNVQCHAGRVVDWNSYGNMSKGEATEAATEFCSGRGTTGTAY